MTGFRLPPTEPYAVCVTLKPLSPIDILFTDEYAVGGGMGGDKKCQMTFFEL